jgi:hypothetical protein
MKSKSKIEVKPFEFNGIVFRLIAIALRIINPYFGTSLMARVLKI